MVHDDRLHLVLVEADKIQSYIFRTGKLTENIGASSLVSGFNDQIVYRLLLRQPWKGNVREDSGRYAFTGGSILDHGLDYELIYSGGGNVRLLVRDRARATEVARTLVEQYRTLTVSADASHVVYPFDPNASLADVMQEAETQMRARKLSKQCSQASTISPHMKLCQSCGGAGVVTSLRRGDDETFLCRSCCTKRMHGEGEEGTLFPGFVQELSSRITDILPGDLRLDGHDFLPKEFDKLADERNFIAVVVIDGNRFGKRVQKLLEETRGKPIAEAAARLRQFSMLVDQLSRESLAQAVRDAFSDDLKRLERDEIRRRFLKDGEFCLPFRPLIIGGDELTFVCRADWGLDIALRFAALLRDHSRKDKEAFGEQGLSCSIGVAIVKRSFPFNPAHRLAEQLLASAKRCNREHLPDRDFSTVDFSVVTTSAIDEIERQREREYLYADDSGDRFCLTGRPYTIDEGAYTASDQEHRHEFHTMIEKARILHGNLAANKCRSLRSVLRTGKLNSEFKWVEMTSRLSPQSRGKVNRVKDFYGGLWRPDTWARRDVLMNNFVDMVEVYDYLGNLR